MSNPTIITPPNHNAPDSEISPTSTSKLPALAFTNESGVKSELAKKIIPTNTAANIKITPIVLLRVVFFFMILLVTFKDIMHYTLNIICFVY